MKSDQKGISTCPIGEERHEPFTNGGRTYVQYDYRNHDGELFSCVAKTLEDARQSRDAWLTEKRRRTVDRIVSDALAEGDYLPPPRRGNYH